MSWNSVAYGARYLTVVTRRRAVDELLARRALGAQPPARDRRVGVALDLHDLLVLDEHLLAAADGAVRADAADDLVGGLRARLERRGARRLRRGAPRPAGRRRSAAGRPASPAARPSDPRSTSNRCGSCATVPNTPRRDPRRRDPPGRAPGAAPCEPGVVGRTTARRRTVRLRRRRRARRRGRAARHPRRRGAAGDPGRRHARSPSPCARPATTWTSPPASSSARASSRAADEVLGHPLLRRRASTRACNTYNVLDVDLAPGVAPPDPSLERSFYTTSSCGLCGKASLDAVRTQTRFDVVGRPARRRRRRARRRCPTGCARRRRPSTRPAGCTRRRCSPRTASCSCCARTSAGTTPSTRSSAGRCARAGCRSPGTCCWSAAGRRSS